MEKLTKYSLNFNNESGWELKNESTKKIIKTFNTKEKATSGGSLQKAIGDEGGSVKIKTRDGRIEEERTYPRSKDPRKSKG